MIRKILILFILIIPLHLSAQIEGSWSDDFLMPGISQGDVSAMVSDGEYLYILNNTWSGEFGGDPATKQFVRWDGETYEQLGNLFKCTSCGLGYLETMILGDDGKIYIGGFFEGANNPDGTFVSSPHIIRWNISTSSWESISNGIDALRVSAIEKSGNTLFVGGNRLRSVTQPDGSELEVFYVAALDLTTGEWSDMDGGVGTVYNTAPYVYDLELDASGNLYVGGNFNLLDMKADSIPCAGVTTWDIDTEAWVDIPGLYYRYSAGASPQPSVVHSLYYDDFTDRVYAGGYFGLYNEARGFAVYDNTSWTIIGGIGQQGTTPFSVYEISGDPDNHVLYVGGNFNYDDASGNTVGNGVARFNLQDGTWMNDSLNGGITGTAVRVNAFGFYQGEVYVGGYFSAAGNGLANNLAKWTGSEWDALGKGILSNNSTIYDAVEWQGKLIVAGVFEAFDGGKANSLAMFDPVTGMWTELGGGLKNGYATGTIYALAIDGNLLHVGGIFTQADTSLAASFASYDLIDETWITYGSGVTHSNGTARIKDVGVFQGQPVIVGYFDQVDGTEAISMALFDGTQWQSIGDPGITELQAVYNDGDSALYIGGRFASVNGNTAIRGIGKYVEGSWQALGMGVDGEVLDIVRDPQSGNLLLGGSFGRLYNLDNQVINRAIGAWNGNEWVPFATVTQSQYGVQLFINKITVQDSLVFFGGNFNSINGKEILNIALYDGCDFHPLDGGINGAAMGGQPTRLNSIIHMEDTLYVFGGFDGAGDKSSYGVAAFNFTSEPLACNPPFMNTNDTLYYCEGDTTFLSSYNDLYRKTWSTGSSEDSIEVSDPGLYTMEGLSNTGTTFIDSLQVVFETPVEFSLGNDTTLAGGYSIVSPEDPYYVYDWNTVDSLYFANIYTTGTYGLELTTRGGCVSSDSIDVTVTALPLYAGGTGDGSSDQLSVNPAKLEIYAGGIGDGSFQSHHINPASLSIYAGGAGDGSVQTLHLNTVSLNIYDGGTGDGSVQTAFNNPSTLNIYSGGSGDGVVFTNYVNPESLEIFAGGTGDGSAMKEYQELQRLLIYSGGTSDGYAGSIKENAEVLNIYGGGSGDGAAIADYLNPKTVGMVQRINKVSKLKVYPNPVSAGPITIELPSDASKGYIEFIDVRGSVVYNQEVQSSEILRLNLQQYLEKGLYMIRFTDTVSGKLYPGAVIVHY